MVISEMKCLHKFIILIVIMFFRSNLVSGTKEEWTMIVSFLWMALIIASLRKATIGIHTSSKSLLYIVKLVWVSRLVTFVS